MMAFEHSKKDFSAFWKRTNKLNARPGHPVSVEGVCDPNNIANIFREHFFVRSPLGPAAGDVGDAETFTDKPEMIITVKDVAQAIKSISSGKSPGHDGLSIEHLHHAGPHICRTLKV